MAHNVSNAMRYIYHSKNSCSCLIDFQVIEGTDGKIQSSLKLKHKYISYVYMLYKQVRFSTYICYMLNFPKSKCNLLVACKMEDGPRSVVNNQCF